jgi:hypothetical protein
MYGLFGALAGLFFLFILALYLVRVLFCLSLYKSLRLVPESKLEFPAWFAFMILIPLAGIVFSWMVVPFNIPKSFERAVAGNAEAETKARSLFGIGLTLVILETVAWIPYIGFIAMIPTIVLWIIFWVKVVDFRRNYLEHLHHD